MLRTSFSYSGHKVIALLPDELPNIGEQSEIVKMYLRANPKYGRNNILKDFLKPDHSALNVRRGVNAVQRKCTVIYMSFIPSSLLEALQEGRTVI